MSEERPTPDAAGDEVAGQETTGQEAVTEETAAEASAAETAVTEDTVAPEPRATDDDAWATACAEDLAREKERRRSGQDRPQGSAAEELRKLVDAVTDKLSTLQSPLLGAVAGPAAQQMVRQVVQQARAAVEPVVERNPDVFDHLAAAGSELLAAYRSAVQQQEHRWTSGERRPRDARDLDDERGDGRRDDRGDESGPGQRIDLD
ncbi:DUF5304 domain-containing protein [Streptomyces antibioticus]|uniref:DUF5304 domain-containing protein n=1 Tax=Streptomyces antibioticus TaxID=1890 RepID=UPI0034027007